MTKEEEMNNYGTELVRLIQKYQPKLGTEIFIISSLKVILGDSYKLFENDEKLGKFIRQCCEKIEIIGTE